MKAINKLLRAFLASVTNSAWKCLSAISTIYRTTSNCSTTRYALLPIMMWWATASTPRIVSTCSKTLSQITFTWTSPSIFYPLIWLTSMRRRDSFNSCRMRSSQQANNRTKAWKLVEVSTFRTSYFNSRRTERILVFILQWNWIERQVRSPKYTGSKRQWLRS